MVHMNLGSYCLLNDINDDKKYIYDPYTVNRKNNNSSFNNPYSTIDDSLDDGFRNRAQNFGTLFIYQDLEYETR